MRLTIIGCSGSYPGPDSPASCYLLEGEAPSAEGGRTWRVLVDLGNGALGALQRYVDPLTIDAVLLSHLHADHCLDLCGYYVMRKYHPTGPQPRIPVWGPPGTAERMARAYDLPTDPGMTAEFDFQTWADPVTIGPFTVTPVPVTHPVPAFGLRISAGGVTVGYTGDTGPCAALDEVARDADLLLAESSFLSSVDNPPDLHLTGADVGAAATRAGARRVVLTHVPPWHDPEVSLAEARTTYDGAVELAVAGATYDL
ncbi:metal-dependent hydrolase [Nocardioides sp. Root1257]|uniref:MBL fold metallo-hydrolase n=1 Tax=unclassified Nocardioides TaxID=2615069 RepID=UPI0006F27C74|nr:MULTISPECIES: MBL fold metallo-hydrolase [unclassified Nocardioides]KQW49329.1 metal-dependent hydrolase [Nocardioides sp. Root1257]KRC48503.1 metal-dependent hydrolase [Nocardioides sp. Root224]